MKLYATTTSERASKGQGGNKYLETEFYVGSSIHSELALNVKMEVVELNVFKITIEYDQAEPITLYVNEWGNQIKAEKKKADGNINCNCGNTFYGIDGKEDTCPKCLKNILSK